MFALAMAAMHGAMNPGNQSSLLPDFCAVNVRAVHCIVCIIFMALRGQPLTFSLITTTSTTWTHMQHYSTDPLHVQTACCNNSLTVQPVLFLAYS